MLGAAAALTARLIRDVTGEGPRKKPGDPGSAFEEIFRTQADGRSAQSHAALLE